MKYFGDNWDSQRTGCEPRTALRRVVTPGDYNNLLCKKAGTGGRAQVLSFIQDGGF